ncbi:MAG: DUF1559 domain-containing protein [Planctomycetaceae bacterium]|nr:DUF1559 domain-containing protein [Planctomycetaceae bacterium]
MKWLLNIVFVLGLVLVLGYLMLPNLITPPEAIHRTMCRNNLKAIGLAMHNYHDVYGSFPPAYVADQDGNPAHSWRILILPYLDSYNADFVSIYEQYRFDEPWDGPNNSELHDLIPDVYKCPSYDANLEVPQRKPAKTLSNYVVVTSPHSAFPYDRTVSIGDISVGTPNTILVTEVQRHACHWMEPVDITVQQLITDLEFTVWDEDLCHQGGMHAGFADGSAQFLPLTLESDTFRKLVTKDGGEMVEF